MKLTASATSPYARKIRILLAEKGIDFELIEDSPWEQDSGVPSINPLGKVPVLETDTHEVFFDSPVIAGYLEALDLAPHFIPADAMAAVRVRQTEALADGILDAALLVRLESLRPTAAQLRETTERQTLKIERALQTLESRLAPDAWFHGEHLSLADIAVGCALEYLDFRLTDLGWRGRYPRLAGFAERIGARPSFVATRPQA
jgi:glutathione S-transferase